jgi:3,4-dihydroxy 2-butanone 4-phosphate synthase/GTP cyclohydrolase II
MKEFALSDLGDKIVVRRVKQVAPTVLEDAFSQIRAARMVVLVSDDSENAEGDLVMAAEKVTPQHVNFMVIRGRGVVSVALPEKRLRELGIPLVPSSLGGETVEQAGALVEAREGVTTGISAADRSITIGVLAADKSGPENLVMPGHVLPLMALSGGVMMRMGRAEGAVDLVRGAGMRAAAALCAILREDGEAAGLPELRQFAATHELPLILVSDLVSHRLTNEILVQRVGENRFTLPEVNCKRLYSAISSMGASIWLWSRVSSAAAVRPWCDYIPNV